MLTYLNNINSPDDLKKLNDEELPVLCDEIRGCLIDTISKNGGHLASNLGVVELSVALHREFNSPVDSILFDVGHQCYTHKLLTGRYEQFKTIRTENGLSGFMRPDESVHDPFVTGHSSNAISAALGICKAKQLKNEDGYTVAVVGDGAMTGGMVFEGLNNAGREKSKLIVILNDNKMSISKNVGGLARYLSLIRTKPSYHKFKHRIENFLVYIPFIGKFLRRNIFRSKRMLKSAIYHSNIFEDLGFHYLGPVDGHDLEKLSNILKIAKEETRPVLVHVLTTKGKGYYHAENDPQNYHGMSPFNVDEGGSKIIKNDFSFNAGDELCKLAQNDDSICAITAAMVSGTGLNRFAEKYKSRFFDVGIAEEHAVTFAAGLASKGMKPCLAVYSSFLQRGYDQIIHDTAIAKLPVTYLIDRAGIVGEDGETHQGVFDIAMLKSIPGVTIYAPTDYKDLRIMMNKAIYAQNGPNVVRYPRGTEKKLISKTDSSLDYNVFGNKNAKKVIVTFGRLFNFADEILNEENFDFCLVKLNKIFPIKNELFEFINCFDEIHIFEEAIKSGGIGEYISSNLTSKTYIHAIDNQFIPQGETGSILNKLGLDKAAMMEILC